MKPTTRHALFTVLRRPRAWLSAVVLVGTVAVTLAEPGRPPDAEGFALTRRPAAELRTWDDAAFVNDHEPRVAQLEPLLRSYARRFEPEARAEAQLFADLARLPNLVAVDFGGADATADRVRAVAELTSIRGLGLPPRFSNRRVDLRPLASLHRLRVLNLGGGDFTSTGLEALTALPGLEALSFRQPGMLDREALGAVARLPALRRLELPSAGDGATLGRRLAALRGAPGLRELRVQTQWNHDEAAAAATAAVPGLKVTGAAWAYTGLDFAFLPLILLGSLGSGLSVHLKEWFGDPRATLVPGFGATHRRAAWLLVAALAVPVALPLWVFSGGVALWPLAACLLTLHAVQHPLRVEPAWKQWATGLLLAGALLAGWWFLGGRVSWEDLFLRPPAWLLAPLAAATLWRAWTFHRGMRPLPEEEPPGAFLKRLAEEDRRRAAPAPPSASARRVPRGLFLHPPGSGAGLLFAAAAAWACAAGSVLLPGVNGGWFLAGGVASTLLAFGCLITRWGNEGGALAPAAVLPVPRRGRVRRYFTRSALEFCLLLPAACTAAAEVLFFADAREVRVAFSLSPGLAAAWVSLLLGAVLLCVFAVTVLYAARPRLTFGLTTLAVAGLFVWFLLDLDASLTPKLVVTAAAAAAAVPAAYAAHLRTQWGASG